MKKLITITLMLVAILLTGCEKNRLVCTYSESNIENIGSKTKYTFEFNEEKIKQATMTTEVTLSGSYNEESFISTYKEMAAAAAEEYNLTTGVSASVSSKSNIVTLKVEMNVASMSEGNLETYGLNLSKQDLEATLEENGYTCE